jgi:hypothetical protein
VLVVVRVQSLTIGVYLLDEVYFSVFSHSIIGSDVQEFIVFTDAA